jgi:hypothetical protein
MSRDNFTQKTISILKERVSGICSKPGCRKRTTAAHSTNSEKVINLGKAAHICAAARGGPRYDKNMSPKQRKSIDNAIWLCGPHADEIDKDDVEKYSVELLEEWKSQAEEDSRKEINKPLPHNDDAINTVTTALTGMAKKPLLAAISNTHKGTENALQNLDSRFVVKSTFKDNLTSFQINPKEGDSVVLGFSISAAYHQEFADKYKNLTECGHDLRMDSEALTIEGSMLFEELINSVTNGKFGFIAPRIKAVHKLWMKDPETNQIEIFDDIHGYISKGSKSFTFSGNAFNGLLSFKYTKSILTRKNKNDITLSLNLEQWNGKDINDLPYFNKLFSFVTKLALGWEIFTALEVNGDRVFKSDGDDLSKSDYYENLNTFFYYVHRSRVILKYLNQSVSFDRSYSFTGEEHFKVAEVADIVEGNYSLLPDSNPTSNLIIRNKEDIELIVNSSEAGAMTFVLNQEDELSIFGVKFLLPPRHFNMNPVILKYDGPIETLAEGDEIFVEWVIKEDGKISITFDEPETKNQI